MTKEHEAWHIDVKITEIKLSKYFINCLQENNLRISELSCFLSMHCSVDTGDCDVRDGRAISSGLYFWYSLELNFNLFSHSMSNKQDECRRCKQQHRGSKR
jgi:hypothetical protein